MLKFGWAAGGCGVVAVGRPEAAAGSRGRRPSELDFLLPPLNHSLCGCSAPISHNSYIREKVPASSSQPTRQKAVKVL